MYINTHLLKEYKLTPQNIMSLQIIGQQRFEKVCSEALKSAVGTLPPNSDLVAYIKGKKGDTEEERLRLSSKGRQVLENVQIPNVGEKDLQLAEFLMGQYMIEDTKTIVTNGVSKEVKKKLGNKKNIKRYCAILRNSMGLTLHEFYYLLVDYLENYEHTLVLEYCFHKKSNGFYSKFENNIEDSSIYQYFQENEQGIRDIFSQKIK